jgi:alkanesulfonate monooxygenase SsuD/methylene tetrahydromethanopterin reductase-like flavin-dependent oxidoreductase (luciferase family)
LQLGTFVFPTSAAPADDGRIIREALDEAVLSEELGMDAVWLAEHHFDGMCAYVDPVVFAAALARATQRVRIGFAVVQASLHHPLRLAEQIALLDHLTEGRLLAGLGKGSMYNDYEYEAFEIDPAEAASRFDEIEAILLAAWTGERVAHRGKYWSFDIPPLRPLPFTKPHPPLLRAVGSDASVVKHAATGRPFLFAGPGEIIAKRVELARRALAEHGHSAAAIDGVLRQSWAWQHVVVADTDREAHAIGMAAVHGYIAYRDSLGLKSTLQGLMRAAIANGAPPGGYILGTPATVIAPLAALGRAGIGGLIIRFDIGPMPAEQSRNSLRQFMQHVAPELRAI